MSDKYAPSFYPFSSLIKSMKVASIIATLAVLASCKEAPTTLQIGIKKKIDPEACIAAKKGGVFSNVFLNVI